MSFIRAVLVSLVLLGTVMADTFYLHAGIPEGKSVLDRELWFDDPVGGEVMGEGVLFSGNDFNVNGFAWWSPDTDITQTFDGTIVVDDSAPAGLFVHFNEDFHLDGLTIDENVLVRPHNDPVSVTVNDLNISESGSFAFRSLRHVDEGTNLTQRLAVSNLTGGGPIIFGTSYPTDNTANWFLAVEGTDSSYTGRVSVVTGTLTIENSFSLSNATLEVVSSDTAAKLVLSDDVTVNKAAFGAILPAGTYTTVELDEFLGSMGRITGSGELTVLTSGPEIPAPTTYYLQGNMASGKSLTSKDVWFDAPTGGRVMPEEAIFVGSSFDVNTYEFRTKNTAGTEVFEGSLVLNESLQSGKYMVHYGKDFQISGRMNVNGEVTVRPHRNPSVSTSVGNLNIGSEGKMSFRTLSSNYEQVLSVGTLSGSGMVEFGSTPADTNAMWSFSVSDLSAFSGVIGLVRGKLVLENDMDLSDATFSMNTIFDNSVVLSNNVSFGKAVVGTALDVGTYTVEDLNGYLGRDRFIGDGTLTVTAGPDVYYLQANIPANHNLTEKEYWFDAPTGGSVMSEGDSFVGNHFDLNGFSPRSKSTPNEDVFEGTIVVSAGSSTFLQYGVQFQVPAGMVVNESILVRAHREPVSMTLGHLEIGPSGDLIMRSLSTGGPFNVQSLSVDNIAGSGSITFGQPTYSNDDNATWSLAVNDTTPLFVGTVNLVRGELAFSNEFSLVNAFLDVETTAAGVVVANDVAFKSVSFGDSSLSVFGTYSAADLNAEFSTTVFSGNGTVSIVDPTAINTDTFAYWADEMGLTEGVNDGWSDDVEAGGGDGVNNLLEYALGGNPLANDAASILPVQSMDGNYMNYVYRRRADAATRGLSYNVYSSKNLVEEPLTNPTEFMGSVDLGGGYESVTNRISIVDEEVQFMGLKVEISE